MNSQRNLTFVRSLILHSDSHNKWKKLGTDRVTVLLDILKIVVACCTFFELGGIICGVQLVKTFCTPNGYISGWPDSFLTFNI